MIRLAQTSRREIHLNDEQYRRILIKIRNVVNADGFASTCYDSTEMGNKFTESNCGFCNEEFTELDTAYWPDRFPQDTSMKHTRKDQKCPFDILPTPKRFISCGCYYTCFIFHGRTYGEDKVKKIRLLVALKIKEVDGKK